MARLDALGPDDLHGDARVLYDAIVEGPRKGAGLTDDHGALRGPFDPLLRVPAIGDIVQQLGVALRFNGSLPDDLRELVILTTASFWRCEFELDAHGRIAERVGVDAEDVAALRAGAAPGLAADVDQRLVHDATVELLTTRRLGDETFAALCARFGEPTTVELVIVVGYYALLAMVLEGFEIRP